MNRPFPRILSLRRRVLAVLATATFGLLAAAGPLSADGGLEDAERFARLLTDTAYRPSSRELEDRYLAPGSPALRRFGANRIGGGYALRKAIEGDPAGYRRAVDRCLPAARSMSPRIPEWLAAVERVLGLAGDGPRPRVTLLFGAGRSGGTVQGEDLVIALEVACRFDGETIDPEGTLAAFLVHEAVHYHQFRRQRVDGRDSLLRQALIEGYADHVTREVLGRVPKAQRARARYGEAHEGRLWQAFQADMAGTALGSWMYGPGPGDAPADLAYWLGLRISEAYLSRADDPARARRDLLELQDPFVLLALSGYDGSPSF
jgi:hypothetical protein